MNTHLLGKLVLLVGFLLAAIGALILLGGKIPILRNLPGDIHIHRKGFSFHFPLTTCILISIALSLIFWLLTKR